MWGEKLFKILRDNPLEATRVVLVLEKSINLYALLSSIFKIFFNVILPNLIQLDVRIMYIKFQSTLNYFIKMWRNNLLTNIKFYKLNSKKFVNSMIVKYVCLDYVKWAWILTFTYIFSNQLLITAWVFNHSALKLLLEWLGVSRLLHDDHIQRNWILNCNNSN